MIILTAALLCNLIALVSGAIPKLPGWTLAFGEDFAGSRGRLPNSDRWLIRTGHGTNGWGNGQVQMYTRNPANVQTTGLGTLSITPIRGRSGWTSGRIETKRSDFMAPAGGRMIIQARIAMPGVTRQNGAGYWPAFWTLGGGFRHGEVWPRVGEFDIMENVNGINEVWQGLHCDVNPGGVCNEPIGLASPNPCGGQGCQGVFHTYSIEVDRSAKTLRFRVDGVQHRVVTASQLGEQVWTQVTSHGHFLILDTAIGGAFPDAETSGGGQTPNAQTISGRHLIADYIAVYYQR